MAKANLKGEFFSDFAFFLVAAAILFVAPSAFGQESVDPARWSESSSREAGTRQTLKIGDAEYGFVWISAGEFDMGSPESEENRDSDEVLHHVKLTKGFWALETEVTQALYQEVMGTNPSCFKGDDLPVESVSWDDASKFCKELTTRLPTELKASLPTEAQWEYACRAGTKTSYWYGDVADVSKMNYDGGKMKPVKSYDPNPWGLYDMHGNVWERCLDWRSDNLSSGVTDPLGVSSGSSRIHRGGSWSNPANNCTSSTRYCYPPSGVNGSIGFRIVVGPDLLKERGITPPVPNVNGRVAPSRGVLARTVVRSVEVFPHADAQNAKWKKRAPWRYTMKVPPANWMEPDFRDGTWKRTNKPVGYGKEATLMRMSERWPTSDIWLRRHFTWKEAKVTRVTFDMFHDENVEIYLNGTRILEEAGSNDRWEPFEIPVETFTSAVREGDNVLAVKVHDNGAPRYFDCGLTVEVEESK